jgi:Cupin-like domain
VAAPVANPPAGDEVVVSCAALGHPPPARNTTPRAGAAAIPHHQAASSSPFPSPNDSIHYDADDARNKYLPHPAVELPTRSGQGKIHDEAAAGTGHDKSYLGGSPPATGHGASTFRIRGKAVARSTAGMIAAGLLIVALAVRMLVVVPPLWADRRGETDTPPLTAIHVWERAFDEFVTSTKDKGEASAATKQEDLAASILDSWLMEVDRAVLHNQLLAVPPFARPSLLPPLPSQTQQQEPQQQQHTLSVPVPATALPTSRNASDTWSYTRVRRSHVRMAWQDEWDEIKEQKSGRESKKSKVDYTDPALYRYPNPAEVDDGLPPPYIYPPLRPLHHLLTSWDPDQDFNANSDGGRRGIIHEGLLHLDYTDPRHRELAASFRNDERPFKLVNVPDLLVAQSKWTDEYLTEQFDRAAQNRHDPAMMVVEEDGTHVPSVAFAAHESPHHHFLYHTPNRWNVTEYGVPPTRINDWTYQTFAEHVHYAEATALSPHRPHFYWQAGVHRLERHQVDPLNQSFISRDLPSLSSPHATAFNFRPDQQRGIQCRFGERGVSAATHYDGGRNSVAMIYGAKRYLLFPPSECNLLGIVTDRASPLYRHTVLNWSHYKYLHDTAWQDHMSHSERAWLERAGRALAIETVLKAGEVLYIPSHWFHSVMSLQRSAQCNVRAVRFGQQRAAQDGSCCAWLTRLTSLLGRELNPGGIRGSAAGRPSRSASTFPARRTSRNELLAVGSIEA